MARQDDDNYWTSSGAKGFDFDSEDVPGDNYFSLFGTSQTLTAQLSHQLKQNLGTTSTANQNNHQKLKHSTSQSSLSSESSYGSSARTLPITCTPQLATTCKLLSAVVQSEPVLSPRDALRSLFLGLPVDLHSFKRVCDKAALLNAAAKLGDGNCISAIVLHLQRTLTEELFNSVLANSSLPWQHYTAILQKHNNLKKASDFCLHLGKPKEAAVFSYSLSLHEESVNQLTSLQQSAKDLLRRGVTGLELQMIQEHIDLLERQLPILDNDSKLQSNSSISSSLIGPPISCSTLAKSSLLATLQYCCQNHWNLAENLLASPNAIRKKFNVTDREFIWAALIGRALSGYDPTPILVTKSLLGIPKLNSSVSLPRVLEVLHALQCSPSVIEQLLPFVDNQEKKLMLAKRFKIHRVVIDVLTSQKDRLGLLKYKEAISSDPALLNYMESVLHQNSVKWKN